MKLTRQQKIARKAVATRKARDEFFEKYGARTYVEVEEFVKGDSNISAAVKANITRGTYAPYVCPDGSGTCNF